MSPEKQKLEFIPEDKVPTRIKKKGQEWLKLFRSIPKGQALVLSEDEIGVQASTVKTTVARFKKLGDLPSGYRVVQRTMGNKVMVYVINSAKSEDTK
ncbi:MAG: hypothetical protein H3Z54_10890 [archaeon]|nr:hypothetical protein [archaeon]